ncbi:MAG TPA: DinB family protein [Bryobacteraceae bacterium]|nr:DinB family protein [Bryobacteraceae bacterium]
MKRLMGMCALSLMAFAPVFAQNDGKLTEAERTYLVEQLQLSRKNFLSSIQGLSEAQWRFKPAPAVWSVAECAEHIVLAEDYLFGASQQMLQAPVGDRLPNANTQGDHALVAAILDRSHKATAPEPITPTGGKFATPAEAAKEFNARRDKTIAYVKSTQDDLRIHIADGPIGKMDSYQMLLLLASHSGRHTLQIREVEGNAGYPKTTARLVFP